MTFGAGLVTVTRTKLSHSIYSASRNHSIIRDYSELFGWLSLCWEQNGNFYLEAHSVHFYAEHYAYCIMHNAPCKVSGRVIWQGIDVGRNQ